MNSERENQEMSVQHDHYELTNKSEQVNDKFVDTNVKRERHSEDLINSNDEFEQENKNVIDKNDMSARKSQNLTNVKHERDSEDLIDKGVLSAWKNDNLTERPAKRKRNSENSHVKTERPGKCSAKTDKTKQGCVGETEDVGVQVEVKEELVEVKEELDIGPVILQDTDMALMMTRTKLEPESENDSVSNMNASRDERPLQHRTPQCELNISIKSKKSNKVSKKGNYECDICTTKFKLLNKLKNHLKTHTLTYEKSKVNKTYKIKCDKCPSQFGSLHNFRKHHKRFHTSERLVTYTCDICQNNYSNKCNLRDHIKRKHQIKTVSCPQCSKVFNNKNYLRRHINYFHLRKRNKKCNNCNTKFISQLKLDIHTRNCKNIQFYCNICNKYYCNQRRLTDHIKKFHSSKHKENLVKKSRTLCDICGLRLDIHKKKCKDIQVHCEICKKHYCNAQSLNDHIRKYHKNRILCDICGKSFSCASALNKHTLRFHLNNKDLSKLFQCDKCIKSFVTKTQLLVHQASSYHTGPTVPCDLCHRIFKISYLSRHKRMTHAHMLPYSCDRCLATFKQKDLLPRHLSECDGCPITTEVIKGQEN